MTLHPIEKPARECGVALREVQHATPPLSASVASLLRNTDATPATPPPQRPKRRRPKPSEYVLAGRVYGPVIHVWCPWCHREHTHGIADNHWPQIRSAHCTADGAPKWYWITKLPRRAR
jgi:hypothetical protein